MTYQELLKILLAADRDELKQEVSIFDPLLNEHRPASSCLLYHKILGKDTGHWSLSDKRHITIRLER